MSNMTLNLGFPPKKKLKRTFKQLRGSLNKKCCKDEKIKIEHSRQESQGTLASKDRPFVHPLAASAKESGSSTYNISNNIYLKCFSLEDWKSEMW